MTVDLRNIKKGDKVFVVCRGWRRSDPPQKGLYEVTAAGPKFITIRDGRPVRFDRYTGQEVTEYVARYSVFASEADYAAMNEWTVLAEEARKLALAFNASGRSTAELRDLILLLANRP